MDSYLRLVLSHGGNPNLENADGDNVLGYVPSVKLKPDKFRLLVDAGADVNHRNQRRETPVMSTFANFNYMLALLNVGADYRIIDEDGWDLILRLELDRMPLQPESGAPVISAHEAQPVFDWLTKEGVNWEAAKKALNTPEIRNNLKNIPADYQHRPWLPQRPTLKKPEEEKGKP
jgi:ankyrin repeat protein